MPARSTDEFAGCHLHTYEVSRRNPVSFAASTIRNVGVEIRSVVAEMQPDIINVQQPYTGSALLLRWPGRRPPIVYSFLSPAPAEYLLRQATTRANGSEPRRTPWRGRLASQLMRLTEGSVLMRADGITVLSEFMRDEIQRWHPRTRHKTIRLIPAGADLTAFSPAADRAALRDLLKLPAQTRILLTVRNLEPRTGVEALLRAVPELARRRDDFLMLVVGRGPLLERLQALTRQSGVADVVRFLGFVTDEDLIDLYRAADLYIQPDTDLQGFGLPIVEALGCGTPVAATPVGGALDILGPLGDAFLFANAEPETMAARIDGLLDDKSILGERDRYRRYAEENFSWEIVIEKTESFFEEVAYRQPAK